jgi:ATP-binding cassette, subfamily B, bacterial
MTSTTDVSRFTKFGTYWSHFREPWNVYLRLYREQKWLVFGCFMGSLLRSILVIPVSLLAREAIDHGFLPGHGAQLASISVRMVLVYLVIAAVSIAVQRGSTRANVLAVGGLRRTLSRMLHELPRAFVTSQDPSEIQSVIVSDTARVGDFSGAVINGLVPSLITMLALTAYLLFLSPILGLLLVIAAPVTALINKMLRQRVELRSREYRHKFWQFHATTNRAVRLWDLTSSSNAVEEERDLAYEGIDALATATKSVDSITNVYRQSQDFVVSIAGVSVLLVGGLQVQKGAMSIGTFLSFFVVMSLAQSAVRTFLSSLPGVIMGREALVSLHAWIDATHPTVYAGIVNPGPATEIEFEDVCFGYGTEQTLNNVNIRIERGSVVAILGSNGAGKTTMINLLMGWYRPNSGTISVGGKQFDDLSMLAWRDMVGLVHQDPAFLNGTVRENIRYGRPHTTDDEIWEAARVSDSLDMIEALPNGLATELGENGVLLSGGQRQRIALTRAIVRHPAVLILDEPTNHLDRSAVRFLVQNLRELPQRPTVIVITHDQQVLKMAQRAYQLDGGVLRGVDQSTLAAVPDAGFSERRGIAVVTPIDRYVGRTLRTSTPLA